MYAPAERADTLPPFSSLPLCTVLCESGFYIRGHWRLLDDKHMEQAEIVYTRANAASAGILEQPMWARNLVGIGLPYRPDRLHKLAESIPWNRVLGSLKV
jgi:hypothetical protein